MKCSKYVPYDQCRMKLRQHYFLLYKHIFPYPSTVGYLVVLSRYIFTFGVVRKGSDLYGVPAIKVSRRWAELEESEGVRYTEWHGLSCQSWGPDHHLMERTALVLWDKSVK